MRGYFRSAETAAFTKKLMKPSRTPCDFSNGSPCSLRSRMTSVMSASLKVVSIAVVCLLSTSLSAIR